MSFVGLALFAEGPTDHRFLSPILRRLTEETCCGLQRPIEIGDVMALTSPGGSHGRPRKERILEAAREACGAWTLLFIHTDGEGDPAIARAQRVTPARFLRGATPRRSGSPASFPAAGASLSCRCARQRPGRLPTATPCGSLLELPMTMPHSAFLLTRATSRAFAIPKPFSKARTRVRCAAADVVVEVQAASSSGLASTLINTALRQHITRQAEPLEHTLRRVIREELKAAS